MRAAISACSVSGRGRPAVPDPLSMSIRIVSSTNSRLPSVRSSASCGVPPVVLPWSQRAGSGAAPRALAFFLRQRLELDRRRADASSTPARPRIEQLGPGEAGMRTGARTQSAMCSMRSSSGSSAQWMSSKRRTSGWTSAIPCILARRPGDLLRASLPSSASINPAASEDVRNRLFGSTRGASRTPPRAGRRRRSRRRLHHLAEGPVRDAFAVRKRAADEDARPLDAVEELAARRLFPTPASP